MPLNLLEKVPDVSATAVETSFHAGSTARAELDSYLTTLGHELKTLPQEERDAAQNGR